MTTTRAPLPLDDQAESLCFSCRYYDWGIVISGKSHVIGGDWEHVCNSPIEGCYPADWMTMCHGFEAEK